ncbi:MAG TPA: hypothetical protein VIJ86_10480 [Acidimicrobiales bacterium]
MNTTFGGDNAIPTSIDEYDFADALVAPIAHVARTQLLASATVIVTDALRIIRLLKNIFPTPPVLDRINDRAIVAQVATSHHAVPETGPST